MTHIAEIKNGIVQRVLVTHDIYGELTCEQWCEKTYGGEWVRCSYTGSIRKNYPGIGYIYDKERDAFISSNPYPSWVLDENECVFKAPNPRPNDGKLYRWNEKIINWEESK